MTRRSWPLVAACTFTTLVGCGADREPVDPAGGSVSAGGPTGPSTTTGSQGGNGAGGDAGAGGGDGSGGQGAAASTGDSSSGSGGTGAGDDCTGGVLGSVAVETVDDVPCVEPGSPAQIVRAEDTFPDVYDRMVTAGTRRVAGGTSASDGPITMALDGTGADQETFLLGGGSIAARDDVVAMTTTFPTVTLHLFEPDGTPSGSDALTAESAPAAAVAATADGWVVGYPQAGSFYAQLTDAGGAPLGEPLPLAFGWFGQSPVVFAASGDDRVGFAFSGDTTTTFQGGFAIVEGGEASEVQTMFCTEALSRVVDVAATAAGWAVLVRSQQADDDVGRTVLIRLDAAGTLVPPALDLGPTIGTWSLRSGPGGLAVAYTGLDARPRVRVFDADGARPAGPAVCLTADEVFDGVAVDTDGSAFVALHLDGSGALLLTPIDGS